MQSTSEKMIGELASQIQSLLDTQGRALVAIDGRCASGKTTLSEALQPLFDCNVIHMDDFFLQPHQRTQERYQEPGGNVDYERVEAEIIKPILAGNGFVYQRFDCQTMSLKEGQKRGWKNVTIMEGAYSCHPRLREVYDLRVFLTVEPEEQVRRIIARSGEEKAKMFLQKWIPLAEQYIEACRVRECCELQFET